MEGLVRELFDKVLGVKLPDPFPRMTYAEAMRRYASDKPDLRIPLELVDVADLVKDSEFKVFAGAGGGPGRPRGGAARAGRRREAVAQADRRLHGVRRALRRQGPRLRQGQRRGEGPRGPAVADPQVPVGCRGGRPAGAHRRADRRPGVLRRRQGQGRQRRARRAAPQGRPGSRPGRGGLAAAVGRRLPDVRVGSGRQALGRDAPPVHRAGQRRSGGAQGRPGRRAGARLRHGAERLGDRRRLGAYPPQRDAVDRVRAARHRRRGSAEEVRLPARGAASTARRRTAASPSASTGS